MKRLGAIAALVALAALAGIVATDAKAATLSKGTLELTPSLAFSHSSFSVSGSSAGSFSNLQSSTVIGYCFTDMVEIGGGLLVSHQSLDSQGGASTNATGIGLIGGVELNFASAGRMVPFVRGAFAIVRNSGDPAPSSETTFIAPALTAGLKLLVGNTASVNFAVDYQHESSALGVKDLSANTFGLEVGVSIFPRGH